MSDPQQLDLAMRSPAEVESIDRLCDCFEAAWKAGARPALEDYLGVGEHTADPALIRELILIDIAYRRRAGEAAHAADYQERVPLFDPSWFADTATATKPLLEAGLGSSVVAGRKLGKFQLLQRVGAGAFGTVWRAHDQELDRTVALKVPHDGLLSVPALRERFQREARAAAQLRHPGIVTVYEVTTVDGVPVIVSDFIDGQPLRELQRECRFTPRQAAFVIRDVAEAVDYAHSMGVIHRDLKPANILVESVIGSPWSVADDSEALATDYGRPKIVDFGLAMREDVEASLTLEGQVIGTPAYMSPEQAAGHRHQVDRRSDVYSLGVVLYELLCGEIPFAGSKERIVHQLLHEEPRRPRRVDAKVPRELETVCLKALAKEPARRYATARALADDLRHWLDGEPIQARPVGALERLWRWGRRKPLVAGLMAALVLVFAGGLAGVTWQWQRAERRLVQLRELALKVIDLHDEIENLPGARAYGYYRNCGQRPPELT